jgi:CRP-like cAMP-binding protein
MDRRRLIQQIRFVQHLRDETRAALAANTAPLRVERGAIITLEGEPAEAMYLLIEGRVKVVRYSSEGREQIMHVADAGDHFNTVPMFDGGPCPATTEALQPTLLLVLRRTDLLRLIEHYPDLAVALLHEFAERLRMLVGLVDDLALHTVHDRLAKLLLQQAETAEQGNTPPPMTQAEMAAHLGTVREMIARTLKSFEAAGLIALERGAIRVLDREGLRARVPM